MLLTLGRGLAPAGRGTGVDLPSEPEPFTGLLDGLAAAALAAYSTRRLTGSYSGACLRLRRASDDAEQDFGFAANGNLDAAAIASWLSGAAGHVATWYDQSGNGADLGQATNGNQPLVVTSSINALPALRFVKANANFLERTAFTELNVADPPHSSFFVHQHAAVASGNSSETIWTQGETDAELAYLTIRARHGSQDWASVRIRARESESEVGAQESSPAAFSDTAAYQSAVLSTGTAITWRKNQVVIAGLNSAGLNPTNALLSDRFTLGCFNRNTDATSLFFGGDLPEFILFDSSVSTGDRDAIEDDQATEWSL